MKKNAMSFKSAVSFAVLALILIILGYYVVQKTNIMNNLPFASTSGLGGSCKGPRTCPEGQDLKCIGGASGGQRKCVCSCVGGPATPSGSGRYNRSSGPGGAPGQYDPGIGP